MSDTFAAATHRLNNIIITAHIIPNSKSNYQKLDIKLADVSYRMFHNKIAKAHNGN